LASSSQRFDVEFQSEISNFKSEIVVLLSGGRRRNFTVEKQNGGPNFRAA